MRRRVLIGLIAVLSITYAYSQDTVTVKDHRVPGKIIGTDTIPYMDLNPATIFPSYDSKSRREQKRFDKFIYNVKIVYPYAKLASAKLKEYKNALDTIHSEKERKVYLKKAEKQLEDKFGDDIRGMTYSQGKILIKLIYRETGTSSFDIVKELRGKFTAFVWQTLARIFGYDLKTTYDPAGEDQNLERIVIMIEAGSI
jgi:hypothetical protein